MTKEQMDRLLSKFPYLWGIKQDWTPDLVDIRVERNYDLLASTKFPGKMEAEVWVVAEFYDNVQLNFIRGNPQGSVAYEAYRHTATSGRITALVMIDFQPIQTILVYPALEKEDLGQIFRDVLMKKEMRV